MVRSARACLAAMDGAGVTTALLSVLPPGAQLADPRLAARIAAAANDELLQTAAEYAPRFGVLLALPLPHVAETLHELARAGEHDRRPWPGATGAPGYGVMRASASWLSSSDRAVTRDGPYQVKLRPSTSATRRP